MNQFTSGTFNKFLGQPCRIHRFLCGFYTELFALNILKDLYNLLSTESSQMAGLIIIPNCLCVCVCV